MILKENDFGRICTEYCVMDLVIIDDWISEELFKYIGMLPNGDKIGQFIVAWMYASKPK